MMGQNLQQEEAQFEGQLELGVPPGAAGLAVTRDLPLQQRGRPLRCGGVEQELEDCAVPAERLPPTDGMGEPAEGESLGAHSS